MMKTVLQNVKVTTLRKMTRTRECEPDPQYGYEDCPQECEGDDSEEDDCDLPCCERKYGLTIEMTIYVEWMSM
jgi:hypothetical protein